MIANVLLGFDVPLWVRMFSLLLQLSTLHAFYLGGDPAAGSPTATLLRLFPPHET